MKTKEYYISALLVVAFIAPMGSVAYGRFEPKQPPITDPYNPQAYMRELAEQLTPEQAEILLRGIRMPSTTPTAKEKRAATVIPRWPPMREEVRAATLIPRWPPMLEEVRAATLIPRWPPMREQDRAATVIPRRTPTPKQYRARTVPRVSKTYSRISTPPSRKAKPKSIDRRAICQPADSKKIVQVHCSNIPEDELSEALKKGDLCLVRLSDDPRIYAIRAPKSAYEPTYCTPVVADPAGRKYLLFSSSDITLTELVQALGRHPSDFSLIKEYDPSHPISSRTSVCSVVSDKLGQLLDFLASGFTRDPEEP